MHLIIESMAFADSIPLFFLFEDLATALEPTFKIPLAIKYFYYEDIDREVTLLSN